MSDIYHMLIRQILAQYGLSTRKRPGRFTVLSVRLKLTMSPVFSR